MSFPYMQPASVACWFKLALGLNLAWKAVQALTSCLVHLAIVGATGPVDTQRCVARDMARLLEGIESASHCCENRGRCQYLS